MSKQEPLRKLAEERKHYPLPEGYRRISHYHDGVYECDHVSPYTISAGKLDADIFVLLQDWASNNWLSKPVKQESLLLGHDPKLKTNINLIRLLKEHFKCSLRETYATNLFPFVKPGNMSSEIQSKLYLEAAVNFALPQIEIVKPKLVICLGLVTFNAMQIAMGENEISDFEQSINNPFNYGSPPIRVWLQAHTGHWGPINREKNGVNLVSEDWRKMAEDFRALIP